MKVEHFTVMLLLSTLCLNKEIKDKRPTKPISGPFHAELLRVETCANGKPSRPYIRNRYMTLVPEVYHIARQAVLRCNLTFHRRTPPRQMIKFKGYQWRNEKWQIKYFFNNINCNGIMMTAFAKLVGLKYQNGCMQEKGSIAFTIMDYDKLEHMIWAGKREYGRMLWVIEVYVKNGTVLCVETEALITPA